MISMLKIKIILWNSYHLEKLYLEHASKSFLLRAFSSLSFFLAFFLSFFQKLIGNFIIFHLQPKCCMKSTKKTTTLIWYYAQNFNFYALRFSFRVSVHRSKLLTKRLISLFIMHTCITYYWYRFRNWKGLFYFDLLCKTTRQNIIIYRLRINKQSKSV